MGFRTAGWRPVPLLAALAAAGLGAPAPAPVPPAVPPAHQQYIKIPPARPANPKLQAELGRLKPGEAEEVAPRIVRDRLGPLLAASAVPQGNEAPKVAPVKKAVPKVERPKVEYQPGWAKPKKRAGPPRPKKSLSKLKAVERGETSAEKRPAIAPAKTATGRSEASSRKGPRRRG